MERGREGGFVNLGALDVEGDLEEDGAVAAVEAGAGELGEGGAVQVGLEEDGALGDGAGDGDTVDLLDAALADLAAGEVGDLDLAADDEQFAAFEEGSAERGDDVGEAGAGGDKGEGLAAEVNFVEVLGGDASGDFMHDRDAGEVVAAALEQVHDVAAGDEEAVGVAELDEPFGKKIAVFFHEV